MRKNIAIVVLAATLLVPALGYAAELRTRNGGVFANQVYLGIKYGNLTIEEDTSGSGDADIGNLGIMFGGHVNEYVALEFDYTYTVSEEEFDAGPTNISSDTLGFFVVGKTMGDIYVKGRVGYSRVEQEFDFLGESIDNTAYGIAYSLGVGAKIGDTGAIEIEYTVFPDTDKEDWGTMNDLETEYLSIAYVWTYN